MMVMNSVDYDVTRRIHVEVVKLLREGLYQHIVISTHTFSPYGWHNRNVSVRSSLHPYFTK